MPVSNAPVSELDVIERGLHQLSSALLMLQQRTCDSMLQLRELFFQKLRRGHMAEKEMKA